MAEYTEVDIGNLLRRLDDVKRAGADLRPLWKDARRLLRDDLVDHFTAQRGPSSGWPGYARSTIERLMESRGMLRRRTKRSGARRGVRSRALRRLQPGKMLGRLKNAWKFTTTRFYLEATNRAEIAKFHQGGRRTGHGAVLPPRPFAWVSDGLVHRLAPLLERYLIAAWESGRLR